MKIKSAVDFWISIIITAAIVLMTGACFFVPSDARALLLLIVAPAVIFLLWITFGTYYELRDDYLYCKSGPFRYKIQYDRIKSIKLCENLLSSMALSRKRIEIREHNKGYFSGTMMISPKDREQFFENLKNRCHNLEKN